MESWVPKLRGSFSMAKEDKWKSSFRFVGQTSFSYLFDVISRLRSFLRIIFNLLHFSHHFAIAFIFEEQFIVSGQAVTKLFHSIQQSSLPRERERKRESYSSTVCTSYNSLSSLLPLHFHIRPASFFSIGILLLERKVAVPNRWYSDRRTFESFRRCWMNWRLHFGWPNHMNNDTIEMIFIIVFAVGPLLTCRIDENVLVSVVSPLFMRSNASVNSFIWSTVSSFIDWYSFSSKSHLKPWSERMNTSSSSNAIKQYCITDASTHLHSSRSFSCSTSRFNWPSKLLISVSFALVALDFCAIFTLFASISNKK